ncbi:hypothetical protein F2P81_008947 [Scophthalmus maximus]|uniref:Uncharacterized protein n=1 Tax=Scophthalmus maximus TaxID=52904 RepID=A0A6A4SXE6_SCOMX|nr:hypothetical protein F2P81_008947 [Scophthalmus maximus]
MDSLLQRSQSISSNLEGEKVAAYFTATFPFVILFILLVRGVTLPGAMDGIIYYLYPDVSRLSDPQVWMDAGTQILFSYAIGFGFLTSLGSYNTYNNNCYRDCFYLCLLNSATSIVAGFAIFSVLGFMTYEQGVDISQVAESVAMMPMPQVWSVCFFSMIILLGLDSQFVSLECLMTSLVDLFPAYLRQGCRRELLLLAFCCTCCLLGFSMVTEGTFIFSIVKYSPLKFSNTYVYPLWANILGWFIATISLSLIPLFVFCKVIQGKGTLRQRFLLLCQPADDLPSNPKRPPARVTNGTAAAYTELKPLSNTGELNQTIGYEKKALCRFLLVAD